MSRSPPAPVDSGGTGDDPNETVEGELATYRAGWSALNKLMRRGLSWSGNEEHCAFLNLGDGRFANVSRVSGFGLVEDGRAAARLDWDGDGDQDLLVTNRTGPRARLFLNVARGARSLDLRLVGPTGNVDAVGARVEVELGDGRRLVRSVRAGEGYLAQSSARLHFGLGAADVSAVRVVWPDGSAVELGALEGEHVVEHGTGATRPLERRPLAGRPSDRASERPSPGIARSDADASEAPARPGGARVVLAAPVPLPRLTVTPPDAEPLGLFGLGPGRTSAGTGRPVLLHLWASWCPPCVEELRGFAARAEALSETGLALLALSVDEDREAARELLERIEWPFPWAFPDPETVERLDALQGILLNHERRVPLPSSFLVSAEGELVALYLGPVDPETLLADVRLTVLGAEELAGEATPFTGTWLEGPPRTHLGFFEARLDRRGLVEAAREFARAGLEVKTSSPAKVLSDFAREAAAQGRLEEAVATYGRAIEADRTYFPAQADLGVVLLRLERFEEAALVLAGAVRLAPEHEDTRFNLALAYLALGDDKAVEGQRAALVDLESDLVEKLDAAVERFR